MITETLARPGKYLIYALRPWKIFCSELVFCWFDEGFELAPSWCYLKFVFDGFITVGLIHTTEFSIQWFIRFNFTQDGKQWHVVRQWHGVWWLEVFTYVVIKTWLQMSVTKRIHVLGRYKIPEHVYTYSRIILWLYPLWISHWAVLGAETCSSMITSLNYVIHMSYRWDYSLI